MHLLNILMDILPIGPDEWDEVLSRHSVEFTSQSVDSIRRKYQDFHRKYVPTGDAHCPDDVSLAKRVKYAIGDKTNLGGGEEDYVLEENSFVVAGGHTVGSTGNDQLIDGLMEGVSTRAQIEAARLDNHDPIDVSTSSLSSRPSPIRTRREKGTDFISMMQMQIM